jgi:hypothetical protein
MGTYKNRKVTKRKKSQMMLMKSQAKAIKNKNREKSKSMVNKGRILKALDKQCRLPKTKGKVCLITQKWA